MHLGQVLHCGPQLPLHRTGLRVRSMGQRLNSCACLRVTDPRRERCECEARALHSGFWTSGATDQLAKKQTCTTSGIITEAACHVMPDFAAFCASKDTRDGQGDHLCKGDCAMSKRDRLRDQMRQPHRPSEPKLSNVSKTSWKTWPLCRSNVRYCIKGPA